MKISTDERFYPSLQAIAQKFKRSIKSDHDRYVLTLPKNQNQFRYLDAIAHQMITRMKAKYLNEKLKIKHETLNQVLVNYDQKTDLIIASSLIKATEHILLDALYDFGIDRLKCRWDEVAALVNDHQWQLSQKTFLNELLRFLIKNLDCKIKEAHIMEVNQRPTICDGNLKPISHLNENLIHALIDLAPRQIFIHMDTHADTNLIHEIEQLFPNCICIEYGTVL